MKTELDIAIKNSEELEKYVDENKDLIYPENNIIIEFEPRESEIRNIECLDLLLCNFKDGGVEKRFDFLGENIVCWGDCILKDFFGRHFIGGNFVGRDFEGGHFIGWNFEGRNIIYYTIFISIDRLRCSSIFGKTDYSLHKSLTENIEYIKEEDFEYGVYSVY